MGFSNLFKYLGLAMEAATQAALAKAKIDATKAEDSPGGSEITEGEVLELISSLDANFSEVVTRILQECDLPVKTVKVEIEIE